MPKEYISEKECRELIREFFENLKSYENRESGVTDKEWLKNLILRKCAHISDEQAEAEALEIVKSMEEYDQNFLSMEEASKKGISKEKWLERKLQEAAIGINPSQYSAALQMVDDVLYRQNTEIAEALSRSSDGHIMMSPNLDGNIAEHMIAKTTELQGYLKGKNIKVEVRGVNTANSVDVRATNLDTGKFQNYQLKFGKDADATIDLIERGNYGNQQIVVPTEQLGEVQEHFRLKKSQKTITDHIEINGVKGRSFTKAEMKQLQQKAQNEGITPVLDDYYYSTKECALSIGKNAGIMALQTAAITTGIDIAAKIFQGEEIQPDELAEQALRTGMDTGVKIAASGTLHTMVKRGKVSFAPPETGANVITGIVFVGIENAKILLKMAEGKLSAVKGMDQMGKVTVAMTGGLLGKSIIIKKVLKSLGTSMMGTGVGFVVGMVGYAAGSEIGSKIYSTAKKVAKTAKEIGIKAFKTLKSIKDRVADKLRGIIHA